MKLSQARILLFIENADLNLCFAKHISAKLNVDYAYTLGILQQLLLKKWVKSVKQMHSRKVFYKLTWHTPIKEATIIVANNKQIRKGD